MSDLDNMFDINNNMTMNKIATSGFAYLTTDELDKYSKELNFTNKEIMLIELKLDKKNIFSNVISKDLKKKYPSYKKILLPTIIDFNNLDSEFVLSMVGLKDNASTKNTSDNFITFISKLNSEQLDDVKLLKNELKQLKAIKSFNFLEFLNQDTNEEVKDLKYMDKFKEFLKIQKEKEFVDLKFEDRIKKAKKFAQYIEDNKSEKENVFKYLKKEEISDGAVIYDYFKKTILQKEEHKINKDIKTKIKSSLDKVQVEIISSFNDKMPSIIEKTYKQNGSLFTQSFIKDIEEGSRNVKLKTTSAFDFKRFVNTFFKGTNELVDNALISLQDKVHNSKIGRPIYNYNSREATKNNAPVYNGMHRLYSAVNTINTEEVGKDKTTFGSDLKIERFYNDEIIKRATNEISRDYNKTTYSNFFNNYLNKDSASKVSPEVFNDLVLKEAEKGVTLENFNSLLKNKNFELISDFIKSARTFVTLVMR